MISQPQVQERNEQPYAAVPAQVTMAEMGTAELESYLTDPSAEPDPTKWDTEIAIRLADEQPRS